MDALGLLISAPSKDSVVRFLNACFRFRHAPEEALASRHVTELGLDATAAAKVVAACVDLITRVLYSSSDMQSVEHVSALLPSSLDARLTNLISSIVFACLPVWREASISSRVSMPPLTASTWAVDVTSAAEDVYKLSLPSTTLSMTVGNVQPVMTREEAHGGTRTFHVDLDHAAMGMMVANLRRIKDTLSSMH